MWSANANSLLIVYVNVAHGDLDVGAVVAVAVAERSGLGSHARDALSVFFFLLFSFLSLV